MSGRIEAADQLVPLQRMWRRAEIAREDSDTAYFYDLLFLGEFTLKLTTLGMLAAVVDARERHRYRLEYGLVRADGVGDWAAALDEVLVGPASQHLLVEARDDHRDLTKRWAKGDGAWQFEASQLLHSACLEAGVELESPPSTLSLRHWLGWFPALRNRTRAHGAPTGTVCASVCEPLERSLRLVSANMLLLRRPWVYLHRNLSGKFRVIPVGLPTDHMAYLKREKNHHHDDGVYVWFGEPKPVHLVDSDVDLDDFYIANGGFRNDSYEALSYITDTTQRLEAQAYHLPQGSLPPSQTDARPELELRGETFSDVPPTQADYVVRQQIEAELTEALTDAERFPVVTLVGRGGIGKTSTALKVVDDMTTSSQYFASLWFSARDIDLLTEGPRIVQPQVLTIQEIADQFTAKMNPERRDTEGFVAADYFTEMISDLTGDMPLLLVFDNFETVRNPSDVYAWLSNAVRLPNKILITTRFRDFKADYPVEVGGMTEEEFRELVHATAQRLGTAATLSDDYVRQMYDECDGHPYVAKVLLGEFAVSGGRTNVKRVLASKDDILDALFERTYSMLPPAEQRVFLTLCNWRSHIPRLALEAALLRPVNERIDVSGAIDVLQRSSLVDIAISDPDGQEWLSVPLASYLFGQRKLTVSSMRSAIEADTKVLHAFGPAKGADLVHGVGPGVRKLVGRIAEHLQDGDEVSDLGSVLQYVARKYPRTWLDVADLVDEVGEGHDLPTAVEAVRNYLEFAPDDTAGWRRLAAAARSVGDSSGEIHAQLQLATSRKASFGDVSDAANRFNALLSSRELNVDSDEKRVMAEKLRDLMSAGISEGTATDYSRLAWLCLHLKDSTTARKYTERGLELDRTNEYCLRLQAQLAEA